MAKKKKIDAPSLVAFIAGLDTYKGERDDEPEDAILTLNALIGKAREITTTTEKAACVVTDMLRNYVEGSEPSPWFRMFYECATCQEQWTVEDDCMRGSWCPDCGHKNSYNAVEDLTDT